MRSTASPLRFTALAASSPGTLADLLRQAYAYLLRSDPTRWEPERAVWEKFDREAFAVPAIGRCVFLSWHGESLVGLGSFDPRGAPAVGLVGHHCILPPLQGRGFGRLQFDEIERRLRARGCRSLRVSTLDLTFFAPARRLYASAGFRLVTQSPWAARPSVAELHFEKDAVASPGSSPASPP